jgi:hypothetical protein
LPLVALRVEIAWLFVETGTATFALGATAICALEVAPEGFGAVTFALGAAAAGFGAAIVFRAAGFALGAVAVALGKLALSAGLFFALASARSLAVVARVVSARVHRLFTPHKQL